MTYNASEVFILDRAKVATVLRAGSQHVRQIVSKSGTGATMCGFDLQTLKLDRYD
jgi:hypothetical protein